MPTFDVTSPDGRKFRINAPEGATRDQALAFAKQNMPADEGPKTTVSGLAKSAGTGLARGVEGLAGLPGDLRALMGKAFDVLGAPKRDPRAPDINPPTSGAIAKAETGLTGGLHEPQTTAEKYAQSVGEFVPATSIGPGGPIAKALAATGGGVGSEAAGQLSEGTGFEPVARAIGGAGWGMLPRLGAKAITPFEIPANRQQSANILRSEGVKPTAGDITGSRALKYAESALGDAPASGGAFSKATSKIGDQFTSAVLRKVGETADRATPDVIDGAFRRIGNTFDTLAARNSAQVDSQYLNDVINARNDYDHLFVDPLKAPIVKHVYDHAFNQLRQSPTIPGDVYKSVRSKLERMRRANQKEPELSHFLGDVREALDGVMERSIARNNPQDAGAWKQVRREYRNMLVVEKAATGAGEAASEGIITPARLRQATVAQGRRDYARGKGDFADLSRAGTHLMTPMPQSGTAPRMLAQGIPAAIGGAAGATLGGAPMALPAALASAFGPGMAGRAVMSKPAQDYLINQYLSGVQTPGLGASSLRAIVEEMGRNQQQ